MTYNTFQSKVTRQLFRYAVTQGQVGPLAFLWALGLAAFTFLGLDWVFWLLWTMVVVAIGYGMMRSYLGNRRVREQLLHAVLEMQCLGPEYWDASLWMSVPIRKGMDILVKAALDVDEMEKERGPDSDVRWAFADACSMLWLQYSLAKNAKELEQSLRLVSSGFPVDPRLSDTDAEATVAMGPLQKNLEAAQELTTQANSRADEVSEQLQAFLIAFQELKHQKAHSYLVAAAELAQETADVLGRMRARAA